MTERNFILYGGGRRYQDDLALIRLPRKAKLNAGTQLACLPLPGEAPQVGLAGWSSGEPGGGMAHGSFLALALFLGTLSWRTSKSANCDLCELAGNC